MATTSLPRIITVTTLCTLLLACAGGRAHDNFKGRMERHVGRSIEDPNNSMNRYPENRGTSTNLPNGNIEQQYHFSPSCKVYFEIDKASQKIIGWRYDGNETDCTLEP